MSEIQLLTPDLISPQQVEALIGELTAAQTAARQASLKAQVAAGRAAGAPIEAPATDVQAMAERQAALEEILETAPRFQLTLAAMPSPGLKRELAGALRASVHPQALVTFSYQSSLIGGMVIRSGSRIIDWSFRTKLLADPAAFSRGLRHV